MLFVGEAPVPRKPDTASKSLVTISTYFNLCLNCNIN